VDSIFMSLITGMLLRMVLQKRQINTRKWEKGYGNDSCKKQIQDSIFYYGITILWWIFSDL